MGKRTRRQVVVALVLAVVVAGCWMASRSIDHSKSLGIGSVSSEKATSSSLQADDPGTALGLERTRTGPLVGIPIEGKPHQIHSPYAPKGPIIDVEGLPAGTQIECPTTGKNFRVPGDLGVTKVREKLNRLVFPKLTLTDQTLAESIAILQAESAELDPEGKGVKIRVGEGESPNTGSRINLDLQNVPMAEALRYVGGLADLRYRTTAEGVEFYKGPTLFTRRYEAPPFFAEERNVDPFLNDGVSSKRAKSAKEILTDMGIEFGEGATAFYVPDKSPLIVRKTGELIVRATQEQLDTVDRLVDEMTSQVGEE